MAIAYRATGTAASVASGNMTPGMPTGWAADDILICQAVTETDVTLAIASGWTLVESLLSGTGQNTRAAWWWRRAVAGDTAPTVTGAAGGSMAVIHAFSGCTTTGTPYRTGGGYSSNAPATSLTLTAATITPGSADDMVVWLGGIEAEFDTAAVSGYSGTNPTFTEGFDGANASGSNWVAMCMAYGLSGNGSATGSRTATIATPTTAHHISFLLALIPAAAGGTTVYTRTPMDSPVFQSRVMH